MHGLSVSIGHLAMAIIGTGSNARVTFDTSASRTLPPRGVVPATAAVLTWSSVTLGRSHV